MDSEDPIYQFDHFKSLLSTMGIEVGEASAWSPVGTIEVLSENIGKKIKFESNGIFYMMTMEVNIKVLCIKEIFIFTIMERECPNSI